MRDGLDAERLREDFPALRQLIHGQRLVYLDNAATVQKPQSVIDEMLRCYTEYCANVHRGVHLLAERATQRYEDARATVQRLIHAARAEQIVFASGATAAINLVAHGWGNGAVGAGDEIVVSGLEHHSNLLPWQELCQRQGAQLRTIPLDERGALRLDAYAALLGPRTRLVAISHVSNALGTLNPVAEITRLAHAAGAAVLVDGAQAVARCPVDVAAIGCDFYAFSGHKLYGPFGIGVLYGTTEQLARIHPLFTGGGMVDVVEPEHSSYARLPERLEAGTPQLAGATGLARGIEYVEAIGLDRIHEHERALVTQARAALAAVPGVRLIGTADPALGVVSFVLEGVHAHDVSTILDRSGIAVRAGHHCAQPVMQHFGVAATVRASFALYNTESDVTALAGAVSRVREVMGA